MRNSLWFRAPLAVFVLAAATLLPVSSRAGEYVVVGQVGNSYAGAPDATRQLLARLFLKQLTAWPNGAAAKVYAAPSGSPEMTAFRDKVLTMNEAALASHWLTLKQKTGETPPREVGSSSIMGKLIAQAPGAIGIMKKADFAAAPGNLKVLLEID